MRYSEEIIMSILKGSAAYASAADLPKWRGVGQQKSAAVRPGTVGVRCLMPDAFANLRPKTKRLVGESEINKAESRSD